MKKLLVVLTFVLGVMVLNACDTTEFTDFTEDISKLDTSVSNLLDEIDAVEEALTAKEDELSALQAQIDALEAQNELIAEQNEALLEEIMATNSKIKNALNRDNWAARKVKYTPEYVAYDAEYCFGVFDEDWSLIEANDYTHNDGLKFEITITDVLWGTEFYAKDSCGNYSEFIYQESPFGFYSMPANYLEVGKTYEVVLYKEIYFTVPQLGLLPLAELGDWGSYPTDLSGIIATVVE